MLPEVGEMLASFFEQAKRLIAAKMSSAFTFILLN
jgi:hypothetical protein